jgi:hypothetical protein
MKAPSDVVERNIRLTGEIMKYLTRNPHVLGSLPDRFELVILPEDDPEIRLYNLDLLDRYASKSRPIVIARLRSRTKAKSKGRSPSLFVPVAHAT